MGHARGYSLDFHPMLGRVLHGGGPARPTRRRHQPSGPEGPGPTGRLVALGGGPDRGGRGGGALHSAAGGGALPLLPKRESSQPAGAE